MTTKTYYAKLDCYSNVVSPQLGNEYYTSFMQFMSYLTASNVASLVAWNSGSGAVSASFNQRGYWDQSNKFGDGPFSLWKFHTSSTRNWEWYMCVIGVSGGSVAASSNLKNFSYNLPISGWSNDRFWNDAGTDTVRRSIAVQSALCISGSTSFNPWNGNFGDGNANSSIAAGNGPVRWVSGANDRTLCVLPRSNGLQGAHEVQRANFLSFGTHGNIATTMRYHYIYDGDALLVLNDESADGTYQVSYLGAIELRNVLSGSGIAGSNHGFAMYTQYTSELPNTITVDTVFGDTGGSTGAQNGGIFVKNGPKTAINQGIDNFLGTTYQPNTITNAYDEFPIYVGISEAPFPSYLGTFNTGLMRYVVNVQSHDMKDDFSRAIVGGSTTISNLKLSIPWTGSVAIGVSTSRTGSNYTWTTNYG